MEEKVIERRRSGAYRVGRFSAMACPCEILLDTDDDSLLAEQLDAARREAGRIESKYSRYLPGNIVDRMNRSGGRPVTVDAETAGLLDYAAECYAMSGGLFDVTSGVLRKIWRFDGVESSVSKAKLARVLDRMGWEKVQWKRPTLCMPDGFEIDFGGIGKEYAADRILNLLMNRRALGTLVNLGGDIASAGPRVWAVGIEDATLPGKIARTVHLRQGALATSGTTKRFTKIAGKIYGHILNPKTGWPVQGAPRSVTVAAKTCTEAGFWSTLGMLQGENAEAYLKEQALEFWCDR